MAWRVFPLQLHPGFLCDLLEAVDDCSPDYVQVFSEAAVFRYFLKSRNQIALSNIDFFSPNTYRVHGVVLSGEDAERSQAASSTFLLSSAF